MRINDGPIVTPAVDASRARRHDDRRRRRLVMLSLADGSTRVVAKLDTSLQGKLRCVAIEGDLIAVGGHDGALSI